MINEIGPLSMLHDNEGTAAPTHVLVSVGDLKALDVILRDIHGLGYADAVRQARIITAGWLSPPPTETDCLDSRRGDTEE